MKARIEKNITPAQMKMIHALLSKNDLMEYKAELCHSFSEGRTSSSRELTLKEAKEFIQYMIDGDKCKTLIRRIHHLGYLSGIIYGNTPEDKAMNTAKLNLFVKQRGSVKKPLCQQNVKELKRTVKQFESIISKVEKKQKMNKAISILEESIDCWIKVEDYEKAQICKDKIKEAKSNPACVDELLNAIEERNNSVEVESEY